MNTLHTILVPQGTLLRIVDRLVNDYGSTYGTRYQIVSDPSNADCVVDRCDDSDDGWDACAACRGVDDVWDQIRVVP